MWFRIDHDLCVYTADYIPPPLSMRLTSLIESTGRSIAFSLKALPSLGRQPLVPRMTGAECQRHTATMLPLFLLRNRRPPVRSRDA